MVALPVAAQAARRSPALGTDRSRGPNHGASCCRGLSRFAQLAIPWGEWRANVAHLSQQPALNVRGWAATALWLRRRCQAGPSRQLDEFGWRPTAGLCQQILDGGASEMVRPDELGRNSVRLVSRWFRESTAGFHPHRAHPRPPLPHQRPALPRRPHLSARPLRAPAHLETVTTAENTRRRHQRRRRLASPS